MHSSPDCRQTVCCQQYGYKNKKCQIMSKIIVYKNSKKPARICTDDTVHLLWDMKKVMGICDEWWCRIPKNKLWDLLHHSPNEFTNNWCPNERKVLVPKYNFYNIVEMINFIGWLKWESILYYLGVPLILQRQMDSFMSMVKHYIPNYRYYE